MVFFSADQAVGELYQKSEVRASIALALGLDVPQGEVDIVVYKASVRRRIIEEPRLRQALEGVLHPLVRSVLKQKALVASEMKAEVLVAEIPLYYETGASVAADTVVVVAASRATQLHRLQSRRSLDLKTAEEMLSMQMPLDEKIERASVVVWNDGSVAALESEIDVLLRQAKF